MVFNLVLLSSTVIILILYRYRYSTVLNTDMLWYWYWYVEKFPDTLTLSINQGPELEEPHLPADGQLRTLWPRLLHLGAAQDPQALKL